MKVYYNEVAVYFLVCIPKDQKFILFLQAKGLKLTSFWFTFYKDASRLTNYLLGSVWECELHFDVHGLVWYC